MEIPAVKVPIGLPGGYDSRKVDPTDTSKLTLKDYNLEGYTAGYINRDGKRLATNTIDQQIAEHGSCEVCDHVGLDYKAFSLPDGSSYRSFAICPECTHVEEF